MVKVPLEAGKPPPKPGKVPQITLKGPPNAKRCRSADPFSARVLPLRRRHNADARRVLI